MLQFESTGMSAFLIFVIIAMFDAISDGIIYKERQKTNTKKHSILKHVFQAAIILLMFSFLLFKVFSYLNFLMYLLSFVLARFAIFDLAYNLTIKQHPLYVGSTSIYDLFLKKFMEHRNASFVLYAAKCIAFICGLAITQNLAN